MIGGERLTSGGTECHVVTLRCSCVTASVWLTHGGDCYVCTDGRQDLNRSIATSPCYLDAYVQLAKVWVAQDRHTDSIATAGQGLGAARIARTLRLDGAAVVRSTCLRV